MIGTTSFQNRKNFFRHLLKPDVRLGLNINELIKACRSMASTKTGALIIITRSTELGTYERTGEQMNAQLSRSLLESIFFKKQSVTRWCSHFE